MWPSEIGPLEVVLVLHAMTAKISSPMANQPE